MKLGLGPMVIAPVSAAYFCPSFLTNIAPPSSRVVGTENKVTGKNGIPLLQLSHRQKVIIKYSTLASLPIRENIIPVEFRMISYDDISPYSKSHLRYNSAR